MTEIPALPETLERSCCSGKPCTTTLHLESMQVSSASGQAPVPTLYRYVRGNGNEYGDGWSTRESLAVWIAESEAEDARDREYRRRAAEEGRSE